MPLIDKELPRSSAGVIAVQQNLADAISYGQIETQYIATAMIGRLIALKILAKKQEDEFFASLSLSTNNKISSLQTLQQRLDDVNNDDGFRSLIDTAFEPMFESIQRVISQINYAAAQDEVLNIMTSSKEFSNYMQNRQQTIFNGPEFLALIRDFLTYRQKQGSTAGIEDIKHFINSETRGIVGKISLIDLSPDGTPRIDWKVDTKTNEELTLSKYTLDRLKKLIGSNKKEKNLSTYEGLRENIANILCNLVKNPQLQYLIRDELINKNGHYDLSSNPQKIRGFLGEIYSAVLFRHLTGLPVYVSGGVKGTLNNGFNSKGKEIGIDLVVNGYGMQIKRYRFLDGENKWVTFAQKDEISLPAMLNNIPDLGLVDALKMFFATMEFNTPWEADQELSKASDIFWEKLDTYTKEIYPIFTTALTTQSYNNVPFNLMFAQFLDRIIRMNQNITNINDETFNKMIQSVDGGITGSDKSLYVNTLFNISGRLIPSSIILDSIIEELESQMIQQTSSHMWDYSFRIEQKEELSPNLTWAPAHQTSILSLEDLIKKFEVVYHINFNLGDVFRRAIEKLE